MTQLPQPTMAKRSWWIDKKHVLHCYASSAADCRVTSLVDLPETSGFFDPELGRATQQINRILQALAASKPAGKELSTIIAGNRPFLAWTQPSKVGPGKDGGVGPEAELAKIRQALGLQRAAGAAAHKRSYYIGKKYVWCYASTAATCVVSNFWESIDPATGSFHDAHLAGATTQVNAILGKLRQAKDPKEPTRALSFILVENAHLLVWTNPAIGPADGPQAIRQALGLKNDPANPPGSDG